MKTPLFWKIIVISLAAAGASWSDQETENAKPRLTLDLLDGSRVIGIPNIASVPVQTPYAKMDVPLKEILALKIGDDHETAFVDMQIRRFNGLIDEVMIFDRSLTTEEVKQIYDAQK